MKKVLSVMLASVMLVGTLASCNSNAKPAAVQPTNNTSEESKQANKEAEPATKETNDSGLDLSKKPKLRVLMPYNDKDPNQLLPAKRINELTGYEIEYVTLPAETPEVKLNTIIASKEKFDIFMLTRALFDATVGTKAYTELNELLPKYAPDLQQKTSPNVWPNVTIEGKIMGIPEANAYESFGNAYRMRTDLMKKAGIEKMPTTTDELYTTLNALKGLNVIPLTANQSSINEIYSAFGLSGDQKWYVVDGKLVHRAKMPGAKEYVTYLNKLYTDGLIDSEWATNTTDIINEKFFSGRAAGYRVAWWGEPTATNTLKEKLPEATVDYLPYLVNDKGVAYATVGRGVGRVMVIPKVAENKEYALNFMNMKVADDDLYTKLVIGDENVHWKKTSDGGLEPILPIFFDDFGYGDKFQTGSNSELYSKYWLQTRVRKDPVLYEEFQKIQNNALKADVNYDPETFMSPNTDYAKIMPKVTSFTEEAFLQMIAGGRNVEDWDKFIAEWEAAGGTEATNLINVWWEQNKADISSKLKKVK